MFTNTAGYTLMYSNVYVTDMQDAYYVELLVSEIMSVVRTLEMNSRYKTDDTVIIDCIAKHADGMIYDAVLVVKIYGARGEFLVYVNNRDDDTELGRITFKEWDIAHQSCKRNCSYRRYLAPVRLNYHV